MQNRMTYETAQKIRSLYDPDELNMEELAQRFGVSQAAIWKIIRLKTHRGQHGQSTDC
jgi:predicted DNA-binding protein (UPF0251 family)